MSDDPRSGPAPSRRQPGDAVLRLSDLPDLPAAVDLMTAARAIGLGRSTAYRLAKEGSFPCRIVRIGEQYRVPAADLLRLLGVDPPDAA